MPKKSYTLAPLREMPFFGVPRRGGIGGQGYDTKATLKTLTQSVKEFKRNFMKGCALWLRQKVSF